MSKILEAHIAYVDGDKTSKIVVALCEEHSKNLTKAVGVTCTCCDLNMVINPHPVLNTWGYRLNRCELCPEDKDKEFLLDEPIEQENQSN